MPDPTSALIQRVRESVATSYDVLGLVGVDGQGAQVLLARDIPSGKLVGISVTPDAADPDAYAIDVQRSLGKTVTVEGSMCPECRTPLPELDAFCFHCGANLSGPVGADGTVESAHVLEALTEATEGLFQILGRLDREGSTGAVYFARDLDTDKIVALRLKRLDAAESVHPDFVKRLTQIFDTGDLAEKIAQRKAREAATARKTFAPSYTPSPQPVYVPPPTPPYIPSAEPAPEFSIEQPSYYTAAPSTKHAAASGAHAPIESIAAPTTKPVWMRTPVLAGVAVLVVAIVGYFAFQSNGTPSNTTTAAVATDTNTVKVVAQSPADSAARVASSTVAGATTPAAATPATPTDSGTIRVATELPADARVTVDGKLMRGRTLRVTARSHQLAITAAGFENFSERVTVGVGATVRWAPKLVAAVVATNNNPPPVQTAPVSHKKTCREAVRAEDWSQAIDVCTSEANTGNAYAASSLGRMYARGLGATRDGGLSVSWYRKGAAGGDHEAQTAMGYALRDGNGAKRDPALSVNMFKQAAEGGERQAQLEFAVALEKGDGISKDQKSAREWYRKSAEQGIFMAARRLARMLEKGDGGPKNIPEAVAAYERAAALGDAESALTLGKWYRDGRGVTQSPAQALIWFKKAADLGNKEAESEVKRLQK